MTAAITTGVKHRFLPKASLVWRWLDPKQVAEADQLKDADQEKPLAGYLHVRLSLINPTGQATGMAAEVLATGNDERPLLGVFRQAC